MLAEFGDRGGGFGCGIPRFPACIGTPDTMGTVSQRLLNNVGDLRHLIDTHERIHFGQRGG